MSFASGNRLATSFPNDCGCGFIPNPKGEAIVFPHRRVPSSPWSKRPIGLPVTEIGLLEKNPWIGLVLVDSLTIGERIEEK
jgi:hypothetical protein